MQLIDQIHQWFSGDLKVVLWSVNILFALTVGYLGLPVFFWTLWAAVTLAAFNAPMAVCGVFLVVALIANLPPLRAQIVTRPIMMVMKKIFGLFVQTLANS